MTSTGVEHVSVVRGGTTVLDDVTLLAEHGELLVILGSSGSGKSTLLRVIAGLDDVTSGEVLIEGRRVTGLASGQRHVAMVFQANALIPFLDVSHNLGFGLKLQRRPEAEVQERVGSRARQLRLSRLLSRRTGELSGGERGLVGIGRALVQIPEVFLLDEPLGDLDAVQRLEVRRQIVEVVRSLGVTALYVTHDPAEGLAVADRVAVLHEGRLVQLGKPRELYERPVNLFVADFVGTPSIGLLPARLVSASGQAAFEVGPRILPMWRDVPPSLQGHVGRDVVLGLRAEDVHDARAGLDPNAVALDAVVVDVEFTGQRNVVTFVVTAPPAAEPPGSQRPGATLRACFAPREPVRLGEAVQVAVDASQVHVFDPVTGLALWHPDDGEPAGTGAGPQG